jgi:hypothetical protein
MLSKAEIEALKKSGFDPHVEKGRGQVARFDLYKDADGNVWIKNKRGGGEAEYTGVNVKDLKR